MLPHFVWQDLADVVDELQDSGYPFELDGSRRTSTSASRASAISSAAGVEVELRIALEPWHVLGEESGAGGTARYVDSSLERLQVKVTGLVGDRHVLDLQRPPRCRCSRPARPANSSPRCAIARGTAPSSLHPTIAVHAPLTFDLVDTWIGRSLGGCQYHVAHPGGINY